MSDPIQSLEPRTLFSAVEALSAINADATALKAQLKSTAVVYRTETAAVSAATRSLPKTAANRLAIATLKRDQVKLAASSAVAGRELLATSAATDKKYGFDFLDVYAYPDSAAAKAKLLADMPAIEAASAGPAAGLMTSVSVGTTTINADLSALVAANPGNAKMSAAASAAAAESAAVATGVQAGVTQLGTDFAILDADLQP
jgi:hypothetical protein